MNKPGPEVLLFDAIDGKVPQGVEVLMRLDDGSEVWADNPLRIAGSVVTDCDGLRYGVMYAKARWRPEEPR